VSRLDNNPVGMALLIGCGLLVVIGLGLTLAWRGPGAIDPEGVQAEADLGVPDMPEPRELGQLSDYDVVLNRPVFNDTRRPEVEVVIEPVEETPEAVFAEEVSDPPKVRLTGVVITPDDRLVTLTPDAGGEALVIREGMPLEGEYVGWSVDEVEPRSVRLLSSRGQHLDFELSVHDTVIDRPPEPEPSRPEPTEAAAAAGEEGVPEETLSRADEIRERIRQRREELRAEAEQQADEQSEAQEARTNAYQDAIRSLMRGSAASEDNDDSEQNDSDDSGNN
jgi:hypothetical protein